MNLTEEQRKIVDLNNGQHLVLAPPGTGKTELLVQRLSNAVKSGVDQREMICLTFTNRAAKNMLDRVEQEVGEHNIFIGNIHSYANTFLRKNKIIPQSTSLLDEEDVELLFKELITELGEESCYVTDKFNRKDRKIKTVELLNYNTFLKQKSLDFSLDILQNTEIPFRKWENERLKKRDETSIPNAIKICEKFERIKKESHFIDFDDLLTLTYYHLTQNIDEKQPIFQWLQIDEVQDLNPLQWAIINRISTKENSHRVFFGDYEQAIFSFMGAKLEILDKVGQESEVHHLQNNFRSPQYLLNLYNVYAKAWLTPKWEHEPISSNKTKRTPNALEYKVPEMPHRYSNEDKWGTVRDGIQWTSSDEDEISWIVEKKLPKEPTDNTAILVRSNVTADRFANQFDRNNTNYFKISGFDLFRRTVIKDLMAFFSIIVNDSDRNAWIRIFYLYGRIGNFKDSRLFVNSLLNNGLKPLDFIASQNFKESFLDDFLFTLKNRRIVVFDTETTGLDTNNDDIIQIAAIEIVNGEYGRVFEVFINTDKDLTESEKIHKISKDHLNKFAIGKKEALKQFIDFIGTDILIAHNLDYDYKILNSNLEREGLDTLSNDIKLYDSIEITKRLYPSFPSYKLEFLLEKLNIEGQNSHNALDDVKATVNLILSFRQPILDSKNERLAFINTHTMILNNFKERFSPIYNAISGEFSNTMPLHEIVSMVLSYMTDHLKYKVEKDVYAEVDKLLKHMKYQATQVKGIFEVLMSIHKYIPEYTKYKESDLVTGNEKIIIATIHKAKGLEFENVIIPGCTDDNFPSYFSKKSGEQSIIEDARLLYVAMTRTKKRLLITSHTKKGSWDQKPSRFLAPIMGILNGEKIDTIDTPTQLVKESAEEKIMDTNKFNENDEKTAYEEHMKAEGYVKINGNWILSKYPEKDTKSYKEALPNKE